MELEVWDTYGVWGGLDAVAVPREVERNLLCKAACREAAVPYIGLAQDHDGLAEPKRGEQPKHALVRAEVLRGEHHHEDRRLVHLLPGTGVISSVVQYNRLVGGVTSGVHLLLDVEVVIVVVFVEVDLHMRLVYA